MEKTAVTARPHAGKHHHGHHHHHRHHTLRDLRPGDRATVTYVGGEGALKRRIMDMGVTKGVSLSVRKVAPFGDPIEITVRGYELSLRKEDAAKIFVE